MSLYEFGWNVNTTTEVIELATISFMVLHCRYSTTSLYSSCTIFSAIWLPCRIVCVTVCLCGGGGVSTIRGHELALLCDVMSAGSFSSLSTLFPYAGQCAQARAVVCQGKGRGACVRAYVVPYDMEPHMHIMTVITGRAP